MNPVIEKILNTLKEFSLARKIFLGVLILCVLAGFFTLFLWANKTRFQSAYRELSREDAASVVTKLKETNIPYKLEGNGTTIMVPESMVYDVRLAMAAEGIPKGGGVGYEIFDKTEFGTTEFVQNINKKRAIQGELSRTIMAFDEVKNARVMIVLPKDSVFVEEVKKPSASILLELYTDLEKEKVASIAHLVASAIQDLTPELVTIVDTAGRILFEGKSEAEMARINAENLADSQYRYKVRYEENLSKRIQTMLERIVGKDKAIVRVTAELDFSKDDMNEEIYDPLERGGEFVRSRKNRAEKITRKPDPGIPSTVNPITDEEATADPDELVDKKDDTFNFEISRRIREITKPMAVLKRLSVAAVVDGKYEMQTDQSGNQKRTFVNRPPEEMKQFEDIVVKAMGYNEDRNDQVSAQCFPFVSILDMAAVQPELTRFKKIQKEYGRLIANVLIVLAVILLLLLPVLRTMKDIRTTVEKEAQPEKDERALIEEEEKPVEFIDMNPDQQQEFFQMMTPEQKEEFIQNLTPMERANYLANLSPVDKARYYARKDLDKTVNILKGWVREYDEEE